MRILRAFRHAIQSSLEAMSSSEAAASDSASNGAQPSKESGASEVQTKPAFRMPDPPKKRPMVPPPPLFNASAVQTSAATQQGSGSASNATKAQPHAPSNGAPGSSAAASKPVEGRPAEPSEASAPANALPQPVARIGNASFCPFVALGIGRTCLTTGFAMPSNVPSVMLARCCPMHCARARIAQSWICPAVDKARLAGIAAAAAAASQVTPAQREKAVADAAAAVGFSTCSIPCYKDSASHEVHAFKKEALSVMPLSHTSIQFAKTSTMIHIF